MPPRKQPATLLALCHCTVASQLASTCRVLQVTAQEKPASQVLVLARRRLRPRFLNALPGTVRAELLERASRLLSAPAPDGGAAAGSGPAPLYLLAMLLAPDVRHLRVELCCYYGCSHQAALLRILAAEGSGLRSLELARSALLRLDRGLLRATLTSATGLRRLVLRNIAGDAVLQVVGACCPVLEVLDVAHSRQVTDAGLRALLMNVELRDKDGTGDFETATPAVSWIKLRLLSRLLPWLRGEGRHSSGKKNDNQHVLLQYCERSTSLCQTLVTLDVTNTGVTSGGVLLALHHAPILQSLGEYVHTGRAFEVLERARISSTATDPNQSAAPPCTTFRLVSARSCRTTPRRLQLLERWCPYLKSLVLVEPRLPASSIRMLPANLTALGLRSTPADPSLVTALYSYLQAHGATLQEITLSFANPATNGNHDDHALTPIMDLAQVIAACPKLRNLAVDNAAIEWGEMGVLPEHEHTCLRTVQLGRTVSACAVTALLAWAPELRVVHLHSSHDLCSQHLGHIAKHSQNMECFYVYEARNVTSAAAVNALLSSCKPLIRLGNLANWGLDCDGTRAVHSVVRANNLQLELNSGAHWFSSVCVRGFT